MCDRLNVRSDARLATSGTPTRPLNDVFQSLLSRLLINSSAGDVVYRMMEGGGTEGSGPTIDQLLGTIQCIRVQFL